MTTSNGQAIDDWRVELVASGYAKCSICIRVNQQKQPLFGIGLVEIVVFVQTEEFNFKYIQKVVNFCLRV